MVRISGVSSDPGFELSGLNYIENNTTKPRGMEIWFELAGVELSGIRVTEVIRYSSFPLYTMT